jgi:DinB superfamily
METSTVFDPRYPVGPFPKLHGFDIDDARRRASIATLAALPGNLRAAVHGLSAAQLDTPYREGGWRVRQVVHHVADSHMNAYARTRLALTEEWPPVKGYEEKLWAELADARTLPVEVSLELLDPLHRRWVALFESLTEEQWQRGYTHSERGRTSVAQTVILYDWHSRHHVAHITGLRKSKGW